MNTPANAAPQIGSLPGDALDFDTSGRPVLIGCACKACGQRMFPAVPVCPHCMGEDMEREAMPRQGILYSFTKVYVGPKGWDKPFAVGYVDLGNGVRVFSHLRGKAIAIDAPVELAAAEIGKGADGSAVRTFVFQPVGP